MALPEFNSKQLLPEGVHSATPNDLKERLVTSFTGSATRHKIYENFCRYQSKLAALGGHVTQWIDGSFVDQSRLDPEDVDAINFCEFSELNSLPLASQTEIAPLLDGCVSTKTAYDTHSFIVIHFPPGHPFEASFEKQRKYWRDWFARPQDYSGPVKVEALWRGRKGFVQMYVGTVSLCPTVSDTI